MIHTFLVSIHPVFEKRAEETKSLLILGSELLCYSSSFYSQKMIIVFWTSFFFLLEEKSKFS